MEQLLLISQEDDAAPVQFSIETEKELIALMAQAIIEVYLEKGEKPHDANHDES